MKQVKCKLCGSITSGLCIICDSCAKRINAAYKVYINAKPKPILKRCIVCGKPINDNVNDGKGVMTCSKECDSMLRSAHICCNNSDKKKNRKSKKKNNISNLDIDIRASRMMGITYGELKAMEYIQQTSEEANG